MKTGHPLVSVIVPCYYQARFLQEAVESVQAQTFSHWECIIINDGSNDNTAEVATSTFIRGLPAYHSRSQPSGQE